jgi:hypothetical protein
VTCSDLRAPTRATPIRVFRRAGPIFPPAERVAVRSAERASTGDNERLASLRYALAREWGHRASRRSSRLVSRADDWEVKLGLGEAGWAWPRGGARGVTGSGMAGAAGRTGTLPSISGGCAGTEDRAASGGTYRRRWTATSVR